MSSIKDHPRLAQVRLSAEILALDGRDFFGHCYRTLLRREPEHDGPGTLDTVDARVGFLFHVLGSDEMRLSPGLSYTDALLRLAMALGREPLAAVIADQIRAAFPTYDEFWAGLDVLQTIVAERTRGGQSSTDADLELRLAQALASILIIQDHADRQAEELSAMNSRVEGLAGRLDLLERKVF